MRRVERGVGWATAHSGHRPFAEARHTPDRVADPPAPARRDIPVFRNEAYLEIQEESVTGGEAGDVDEELRRLGES